MWTCWDILPPYRHISKLNSCDLSNIIVQRVQRTKLDSENVVNDYQFIRYLLVVFKKNSSVKYLIYLFCLSKCFCRNKPWDLLYFRHIFFSTHCFDHKRKILFWLSQLYAFSYVFLHCICCSLDGITLFFQLEPAIFSHFLFPFD